VHQVHHLFPLFFTCFHCCNLLHGRLEFHVVYLYVSMWLWKLLAQVEGKDRTIATFQRTLDEAEAQHQNVQTKHFTMLDSLIDLHYMRTKVRSCYYFHSAGSLLLVLWQPLLRDFNPSGMT
jgi:hypothetical protein